MSILCGIFYCRVSTNCFFVTGSRFVHFLLVFLLSGARRVNLCGIFYCRSVLVHRWIFCFRNLDLLFFYARWLCLDVLYFLLQDLDVLILLLYRVASQTVPRDGLLHGGVGQPIPHHGLLSCCNLLDTQPPAHHSAYCRAGDCWTHMYGGSYTIKCIWASRRPAQWPHAERPIGT